MSRVLVTIQYDVEPAKREAYLAHAREMREHATESLGLDYQVYEDADHPGRVMEMFTFSSEEEYDSHEEKQDDTFRTLVARLERFTDLSAIRYSALKPIH